MTLRIVDRPSPNYGDRRGKAVRCIVLHADASKAASRSLGWLVNPASQVSYHYLVDRDGTIYRLVAEDKRAWHAGRSLWGSEADVNGVSIGVSFANDQAGEPFTRAQLDAGARLCAELCERHTIPPHGAHITTHEAVAVPKGRKTDPGPLFPLAQFVADAGTYYGARACRGSA